jgi:hypothetical protein
MNSIFIKQSGVVACVSMLVFSTGAQAEGDTEHPFQPASVSVSDLATISLDKESFTLGLVYSQVTYKTTNANSTSESMITDNGAPSPIIELNSSEKVLKEWPMRVGSAVLGWDINASASVFNTHYQLTNSALRGQNIGTDVSGGYIGVAPILFLKIGPLYPGSDLYLKLGGGIGPGYLQSSGTADFNGTINSVGSTSPVFALYKTASWQFQAGHWYFNFIGTGFTAESGLHTSLESYGFGVAYRFVLQ